ncbi:hypothetical protein HS088_TW13G00034 [Tripterygium wilfordii]|uniref:Integral membrane bound transporter domain-containing protein n=1 Tax=Tripterygium wilfordii TaxID=458696 RepID=A0A7J7CTD4_TRIWF|nr:uncharacterized protein LOC120012236 [Tripterygium wilfordii]KAF5737156.1 hypothetical protein HS088_TW13G00034 [Tripterygium wilfordii]
MTSNQTHSLFRMRLGSALRTTLACTIVGCIALYGPVSVRQLLPFPAFSYVTTILIVSDATLGETLRGCWHALYATIQVMIPSTGLLYVVGPARFTRGLAALAVAVGAFLVALPKSTPMMTKRIAFGQLVIVYVGAVVLGEKAGVFMHPIHVSLNTALGALASVLAMLFPFPRLAYFEVRRTCRLYAENASERLNLLVEALSAEDKPTAAGLTSQSNFVSKAGSKHLQSIKHNQVGVQWEKPNFSLFKRCCIDPGEKLQGVEILMRGMGIAINSQRSFPVGIIDEELRHVLQSMKANINLKLEHAKCFTPFSTTVPEMKGETSEQPYSLLHRINATTHEDLPSFFFLYCMELLQDNSHISRPPTCTPANPQNSDAKETGDSKNQATSILKRFRDSQIIKASSERLIFATKCSLSLGLAVLFGLIYDKGNGYWSGLTIAISFAARRQATFTVANARAQGTAMGSVYGILCCFIFGRFLELKILPLLPWIVFTSFLRYSRMYGQAGAISAVIGALLILGRKGYGSTSDFAIARITEASIGLISFIIVQILLEPTRAATLGKAALSQTLGALQDCIEEITLCSSQKGTLDSKSLALREKQKLLESHLDELENYINEAKLEPSFWFLPFPCDCYDKLLGSISKMADLLLFASYTIEYISQESKTFEEPWQAIQDNVNDDLDLFQEKVSSALKCLRDVVSIKSLEVLEKELKKKNMSHDVELGKPSQDVTRKLGPDEGEVEEIINSFLQHPKAIANRIHTNDSNGEQERQLAICLSGLGFCISGLMREIIEIEKEINELVKRENPTRHINLREISCTMTAVHTK